MQQPVFAHSQVALYTCGLYQDTPGTQNHLDHYDLVPSYRIYDSERHLIPYVAEKRLGEKTNYHVAAIRCFQQETPDGDLELVVYLLDRGEPLQVGSFSRRTPPEYPDAVVTALARAFTHDLDAIFEVNVPLPDVVGLPFVEWVREDRGDGSWCSWNRPGYGPPGRGGPPRHMLKMVGVHRWLAVVSDARRLYLEQLHARALGQAGA